MTVLTVGVISLLFNLQLIADMGNLILGLLFLLVGLISYRTFVKTRSPLWIFGVALVCGFYGLALMIKSFVEYPAAIVNSVFLWVLSIFFAYLHIKERQRGWAAFLCGLFLTLGTLSLTHSLRLIDQRFEGTLFLTGVGLSFLYLWLQRFEIGNVSWAIYPAILILLLALTLFLGRFLHLGNEITIAFILIAIGLYVIYHGKKQLSS